MTETPKPRRSMLRLAFALDGVSEVGLMLATGILGALVYALFRDKHAPAGLVAVALVVTAIGMTAQFTAPVVRAAGRRRR